CDSWSHPVCKCPLFPSPVQDRRKKKEVCEAGCQTYVECGNDPCLYRCLFPDVFTGRPGILAATACGDDRIQLTDQWYVNEYVWAGGGCDFCTSVQQNFRPLADDFQFFHRSRFDGYQPDFDRTNGKYHFAV